MKTLKISVIKKLFPDEFIDLLKGKENKSYQSTFKKSLRGHVTTGSVTKIDDLCF